MNKTSYQVSDASIKRYWKMWESNRVSDDELNSMKLFNKWSKQENFCSYTKWDALRIIAKDDYELLSQVIYDLREKTEKLSKIADAFEIISYEWKNDSNDDQIKSGNY